LAAVAEHRNLFAAQQSGLSIRFHEDLHFRYPLFPSGLFRSRIKKKPRSLSGAGSF